MMAKVKLIITEAQHNKIFENFIIENDYSTIVSLIHNDLNKNYEKHKATVKGVEDYHNDMVITVKVDKSVTTPSKLLNYLHHKHSDICGKEFIKQVISDWFYNTTDGKTLSKNVPLK